MLSVWRKIHNVGGSLLIVLPKIWTDSKGLKPRDTVEIQLNDNLTIVAPKKPVEA
jgi:antitoxin component of MazEF toxin-antitoxin module